MLPKAIPPTETRALSLYDVQFRYAVGAAESDGALAMLEVTIPPRTLVKPHRHSREDEFTLVLSGAVGARLGDDTIEELGAGSWLVKPREIPHALWNVGDEPARILEVVVPGGLERYFELVEPILGGHDPGGQVRFEALAAEYGLTILDDWTEELEERYGIRL